MEAEGNLCRGWTASAVERLCSECTPRQLALLEALAEHSIITLKELAVVLDEQENSVDGLLGSLGVRAKVMDIRDEEGNLTWPFYINADPLRKAWIYQMPRQVAEIIKPGSRAKAHPANL